MMLCAALLGVSVAASAAGIKPDLKIAFVPKQINNPYEVIADDGGMAAIKEFKGQGKVVGPSDAGASSQVSYINTLTTQRQDAIVIAANDANALVPYLKKAMSQGIKVVTFDSDTAPDGRQLFVNQANAESIGRGQIQLVSKLMGGEGEFAILSATPNATNQNTWI
jgi:rhamnose transport system substrate-binding protein